MTNPNLSIIKTIAVFANSSPKDLQLGNYVVIPSTDQVDNTENAFAVLNISLESAMSYAVKYNLASFPFSIYNEGNLATEHWEKQDLDMPYHKNTNPYVKRSTDNSVVVNVDNANCCSAMIGNTHISIPLSVINQIDDNLSRLVSEGKISNKEGIIDHSMKSGQSPYLWRGAIYKGIL